MERVQRSSVGCLGFAREADPSCSPADTPTSGRVAVSSGREALRPMKALIGGFEGEDRFVSRKRVACRTWWARREVPFLSRSRE
jgi:hypothetical protein